MRTLVHVGVQRQKEHPYSPCCLLNVASLPSLLSLLCTCSCYLVSCDRGWGSSWWPLTLGWSLRQICGTPTRTLKDWLTVTIYRKNKPFESRMTNKMCFNLFKSRFNLSRPVLIFLSVALLITSAGCACEFCCHSQIISEFIHGEGTVPAYPHH